MSRARRSTQHTRRLTAPTEGGAQQLVTIIRSLDEAGIAIDDIGLRRPTLDDVFLSLTGHAAEETEPEDEKVPVAARRSA